MRAARHRSPLAGARVTLRTAVTARRHLSSAGRMARDFPHSRATMAAPMLRSLLTKLRGNRAGLVPYRIERAAAEPVGAPALAIAILGAGFRVDERWRRLVVSRTHARDQAIVPLPWSRTVGPGPIVLRASDRDLVLGLMTAMSAVLGTLRLHTAELGEVIVQPPAAAVSPNMQRAWAAVARPRAVSHYALDEPGGRARRR
jgi:hypothetical protein